MPEPLRLRLDALRAGFVEALDQARRRADLDSVKGRFIGRKGVLPALLKDLASLPPGERREAGAILNAARTEFDALFAAAERRVEEDAARALRERAAVDVTLPPRTPPCGLLHPITRTRLEIEAIFRSMGYSVESGPEVETDFHNFEALNMPPDHPARDAADTFYVDAGLVLRTHTSPVQIRTMQRQPPPIRMIAPGPVYRRDYDLTHLPMFHQVEGLVVDRGVTMGDLKGTLEHFLHRLLGANARVRFAPTYFPFVEPGAEVNVSCTVCGGSGCRTCKGSGWLEVLGAGMVHPQVLRAVGLDPEAWTGFAFGLGIDRIAMLQHGIDDLRVLLDNDLRFLRQFPASGSGDPGAGA